MPTPSMGQSLGRVWRSPDSQVLSIPFGSEYVVLIKRVHLASWGSCWKALDRLFGCLLWVVDVPTGPAR